MMTGERFASRAARTSSKLRAELRHSPTLYKFANRKQTPICLFGKLKRGLPDLDTMVERPFGGFIPSVDPKTNGSALHENNWMMAVFAGDRRRQPKNKARLSPPVPVQNLTRTVGGTIYDEMPVIANDVVNFSFSHQALDEGHIDDSGRPALAAANGAYLGPR